MDLPESRTEGIKLWVVVSCRPPLHAFFGRGVRVCGTEVCLPVQFSFGKRGKCLFVRQPHHWVFCPRKFFLSSEYNFTNYYSNTCDYFLKPCWLDLCNGDVVSFLWGRIHIFTFNLLGGVFQGSEIWAAAVSVCLCLSFLCCLFVYSYCYFVMT